MSKTYVILKNNVRIYVSDFTEIAQTAIEKHQAKPLAGLTMSTAIATFGVLAIMKKEGKTSVFLSSDGALKNLGVESNANGDIRAFIGNPLIPTDADNKNPNDIPISIGTGDNGTIKVVHQFGDHSFGGEVSMVAGDIVTDMAYYLDQSEQINSAVVADIKLKDAKTLDRAYSAIFQMLPLHGEADIQWVEDFIKNNKLSQYSLMDYINKIDGNLLETKETRWKCNCSEEKMKNLLELISEEERNQIIKEHGKLEVKCNYCNTIYSY